MYRTPVDLIWKFGWATKEKCRGAEGTSKPKCPWAANLGPSPTHPSYRLRSPISAWVFSYYLNDILVSVISSSAVAVLNPMDPDLKAVVLAWPQLCLITMLLPQPPKLSLILTHCIRLDLMLSNPENLYKPVFFKCLWPRFLM